MLRPSRNHAGYWAFLVHRLSGLGLALFLPLHFLVLGTAIEGAAALDGVLTMEDWHNFGADYDRTLLAWHANFRASWPRFEARLGERFYRAWSYYLRTFAGVFRARELQLWQLVLTRLNSVM